MIQYENCICHEGLTHNNTECIECDFWKLFYIDNSDYELYDEDKEQELVNYYERYLEK